MIKTGDILEIPTKEGIAYAVVVFDYVMPPKYGKLVYCYNQKFKKSLNDKEILKLIKTIPDFTSFVGFNNKNMQELGIKKVRNVGDFGYNYENLPQMWIFRPEVKLGDGVVIKKHFALMVPGEGVEKEQKIFDPKKMPKNASRLRILNTVALKEEIENNYDSQKDILESFFK